MQNRTIEAKIPRINKKVRHKFSRLLEAIYLMTSSFWNPRTSNNIASKVTISSIKKEKCKLKT